VPRKQKWTSKDQAALETLVRRHGAAMVAEVARKCQAARPVITSTKRPAGRPKGYAADALSVVWAVEVRRNLIASAGGRKVGVPKVCQQIAKDFARLSAGGSMTASALLSLFNDGKKLLREPKASVAADLVGRAILETTAEVQSHPRSIVLPVRPSASGSEWSGPSVESKGRPGYFSIIDAIDPPPVIQVHGGM
jgi:hypothetical protein